MACVGNPAESIPAAEMPCLSAIGENLEFLLRRLTEASSTKDPGKPGPVELQPKKMGQVRLATSKP